jgi:dihydroflavonol-4-reductase
MGKVLITGGTGFIGNHVTRLALESGDDVRVMVMPGEDRSPLDGMDVEFVEGNLLDHSTFAPALKGVERMYHMAALFAVWTKDPDLHYKINVEGTEALLREAQRAGLEKVVFTSSAAALGLIPGQLSNEETPFNCWPWASDYIFSKYISHQVVNGLIGKGLPATIVLPGLPFGPGDRAPTPTGELILMVLRGKAKNWWKGGICPVDVRDVARGHVLAMEKGRVGEAYCLANTEANISQRDLLKLIGRIAGVEGVAEREVPEKVMLRAARVMEWWSKITGKAPTTTYKNTLFALQECYVDSSKAVNELGMPQSPIEQAIEDSITWFREHDYV